MDIADFPALKSLNPTQIENLRNVCEIRRLPAGEELIRRGEQGGELYFLLEGDLLVYVPGKAKEIELAELRAPAVVGELEFLTGSTRTASVRTLTEARVMAIPQDRVQARVDDGDPATLKVMFAISRMIAARLASLTEKFVEIETNSEPVRSDELRAFRAKLFSEWTFDQSP